jgi:hypothetical protein
MMKGAFPEKCLIMPTLRARELLSGELGLEEAHRLLGLEPFWEAEFEDFLSLPSVTEEEQRRLAQLRSNFERYLLAGQVSEGQVRIVSVNHQEAVWGLVTNGEIYRFFYIRNGTPTLYHHMPSLSLMRSKQLTQLLQVLKAIRDWIP